MRSFHWKQALRKKSGFLLAFALLLALSALFFFGLRGGKNVVTGQTIGPFPRWNGWSFFTEEGETVQPDAQGRFDLPEGSLLYCSCTLPDALPNDAILLISGSFEGAVTLDGAPADTAGEGLSHLAVLENAAGRVLTVSVRLTGASSTFALPSLTLYQSLYDYHSCRTSLGLVGGIFLASAALLLGLFLYQMWKGPADWPLLFTGLFALFSCIARIAYLYTHSVTPGAAWFFQMLPPLPLAWLLWYRSTGRSRRWGWLLPAALTAVFLCLAALAAAGRFYAAAAMFVRGKLLPLAICLLLLETVWEAVRGGGWHRRFLLLSLGMAGAALAVSALSLTGGSYASPAPLQISHFGLLQGSLFPMLNALCCLLLFSCLLLAVHDYVQATARRDVALQTMILQKRHMKQHAAALYRSLEDTQKLRHEMRHHMEAMRALCQAGDLERAQKYADALCRSPLSAPAAYTQNPLINALLSERLERARAEGVRLHIVVQVPEELGIEDADLSMFLANLLDNAVEAACAATGERRFLTLRLEMNGRRLSVFCQNGYDGSLLWGERAALLSNKKESGHGYGLQIMRSVAEKYHCALAVRHDNGRFSVRADLLIPEDV